MKNIAIRLTISQVIEANTYVDRFVGLCIFNNEKWYLKLPRTYEAIVFEIKQITNLFG